MIGSAKSVEIAVLHKILSHKIRRFSTVLSHILRIPRDNVKVSISINVTEQVRRTVGLIPPPKGIVNASNQNLKIVPQDSGVVAKEQIIIKTTLNDNEVLVITNKRVRVYNNRVIRLDLDLDEVIAITPRENSITIHYIRENYGSNPVKCDMAAYDLVGRRFTSLQLCSKIFKELLRPVLFTENERYLCLEPDEYIEEMYKDSLKIKDHGTLYITNFRIIFEADVGALYSLSFELVSYVGIYRNGIDVQWDYPLANFYDPIRHFRIALPKDVDRNSVSLLIKQQFAGYDLTGDSTFAELNEYYSNLEREELYKLAREEDKDLDNYITNCIKFVFGVSSPIFLSLDKKLILACKLHGWDIDLVSTLTREEINQRIFAKRIELIYDFLIENLDTIQNVKPLDGPIWSGPGYVPTQDIRDLEVLAMSVRLFIHNPEISERERNENRAHAEALRYYDKRVAILYKEWCENVPLPDFTDECDDEWIKYLLKRSDNPRGRAPINENVLEHNLLEEKLIERDKNRITLANFSTPDDIPERDIYNNCWYDKHDEMWYIQDDNLPEHMYDIIDWDPDKSEQMIGRRVWGIQKYKVEMFCGYPCLKFLREDTQYLPIATSRKTGQHSRLRIEKIGYYAIPILRDTDITSRMCSVQ